MCIALFPFPSTFTFLFISVYAILVSLGSVRKHSAFIVCLNHLSFLSVAFCATSIAIAMQILLVHVTTTRALLFPPYVHVFLQHPCDAFSIHSRAKREKQKSVITNGRYELFCIRILLPAVVFVDRSSSQPSLQHSMQSLVLRL